MIKKLGIYTLIFCTLIIFQYCTQAKDILTDLETLSLIAENEKIEKPELTQLLANAELTGLIKERYLYIYCDAVLCFFDLEETVLFSLTEYLNDVDLEMNLRNLRFVHNEVEQWFLFYNKNEIAQAYFYQFHPDNDKGLVITANPPMIHFSKISKWLKNLELIPEEEYGVDYLVELERKTYLKMKRGISIGGDFFVSNTDDGKEYLTAYYIADFKIEVLGGL